MEGKESGGSRNQGKRVGKERGKKSKDRRKARGEDIG